MKNPTEGCVSYIPLGCVHLVVTYHDVAPLRGSEFYDQGEQGFQRRGG